jgi:predicted AAA+ superfamily ATPase
MFSRLLTLPARRSCLLLGPRQTGKSTLVRSSLPEDAWTVDLLEHDTFLRFARDPSQFRREAESKLKAGTRTIFVDEVQKVPELLDEVHALIERHRARFILTGSSARKLRRRGTNLLGGRAATRRLHPLVRAEMGESFDLERVLRYGALPAVVTDSDEDAREILRSYAETYLREEIQAEALVRNLGGFSRFLDIAAAQSGELLNFSSVARDASLAVRTVQEYFEILEDTLIGLRLEPWRKSVRSRLVAHPKFYLFDTGVVNALCHRLGAEIDPSMRGRLFEHFVVLECVRAIDISGSEARTFFWRTNHGAEVDLVIERHGKLEIAVEIKAKARIGGPDVSGLRAFAEQHPRVPLTVACLAREESTRDGIRIVPYAKLLDELWSILA